MPARGLALAALLAIGTAVGVAQSVTSQSLLTASETIVGEPIAYPATGTPVVTSVIVTIAPGQRTGAHRHGVPMAAYILEGELTVDYGEHGRKTYSQGQSFLEAMDVNHVGMNTGSGPVRILSIYMGAEGSQNVLPPR
ncbi:MAG: cupin domain-containing protein [Vicinamibacterales bacterium]